MVRERAAMDRLKAMSVFVEVAERGSLSAAAEALSMSRAMVSRALAALETWLGARLFHRTTRQLTLTAAGELALSRCRTMLDLEGDLRATLDDHRTAPAGHVRMTCSPSFAQSFLAAAVSDFVALHPGISVDLLTTDRTIDLIERRIDLAIRISNRLDANLVSRKLSTCRSVLCASPAYIAAHGTPGVPSDLANHQCLAHQFMGQNVWVLADGGDLVSVPVRSSLCANEASVLMAAVLADAGIALLPTYLVAPLLRKGALIEVLPAYPPAVMGIHGVYASRRQMPAAVRALLGFLAARLHGDPIWET